MGIFNKMLYTKILVLLFVHTAFSQILEPCRKDAYPPKASAKVKKFVVNLDVPPDQRWADVVVPYKEQIINLIQVIKDLVPDKVIKAIDDLFPVLLLKIPHPYSGELLGISEATGIHLGEIILYNLFYEVNPFCTSIVGQDETGKLYHGRNLDFGLLMGWDNKNNTWILAERLRDAMITVDYQRNGKTLYSAAHFAGYVGLLTAIKKNAFTMTINHRFGLGDKYLGVLEWLVGKSHGKLMGFLTRDTFENATDYKSAVNMLSNTEMIAAAYFIVGGSKAGEAAVITRSRLKADDIMTFADKKEDEWYLLETNYDHWKKPLFIDDRRTPGNKCMKELTQKGMNLKGLYNVLSTKPNLNKLTTYTALMQVNDGTFDV